MKAKKWLKGLKKNLKTISFSEKQNVVGFYEELINDKIENGEDEEVVIANLGNPIDVAEKISSENSDKKEKQQKSAIKSLPIWAKCILYFFIITVGIPLFISWIAVVVSFGAVSISGFAITVAGIIYTIASIIVAVLGIVEAKLAVIGSAIALTGVGLILISIFYYITKSMVCVTKKLVEKLLKGGNKQ